MAHKAIFPEMRFLRAVFPHEFPEQPLGVGKQQGPRWALEQLRQQIDAALSSLSYRERGILEMRYGLGDGYAYTLAEAGYVFKLTRERIRQLQVRAVRKLRKRAEQLRSFLEEPNQ